MVFFVIFLFPLIYEIHGIFYIESCVEDIGSLLRRILFDVFLIWGEGVVFKGVGKGGSGGVGRRAIFIHFLYKVLMKRSVQKKTFLKNNI